MVKALQLMCLVLVMTGLVSIVPFAKGPCAWATMSWKPAEAAQEKLSDLEGSLGVAWSEGSKQSIQSILSAIPDMDNASLPSGTDAEIIVSLLKSAGDAIQKRDFFAAKRYCKYIIVRFTGKGKTLNGHGGDGLFYSVTYEMYLDAIELNGVAQALLLLGDILRREGKIEDAVVVYHAIVTDYVNSFVYDTR